MRGVPIGIVVTKAFGPTVPPATQIISRKSNNNKMLTSIPMNGMTYAESLRANFSQKLTGNENIPDFEPPRLNNMERKLQI